MEPIPTNQKSHNNVKGASSKKVRYNNEPENASSKFDAIHTNNVEKAKAFRDSFDSSSEEEELNDENILSTVFQNYTSDTQLAKVQIFLENFLQSGSAICLICIGSMKRVDAIWSCDNCYCFFHLTCIQRWANDSICQQKMHSQQEQGYYRNDGTYISKVAKPIKWCCPKCRFDYKPVDVPKLYTCFCGKKLNPQHHPWLIPHSCGETCGNYLQSDCGHKCLLLCHPGPCPQCPQNITVSCKCERSARKSIRCFQKNWTCDAKCKRILACGFHKCEQLCHEEEKCPPCTKKSKQSCECGNEVTFRNCYELTWKCSKICNKKYSCGIHKCIVVCHAGDCGECAMGLPRTCPCGKTSSIAPCNEEIDNCGDTCQKILLCNNHVCVQRCHKGECSACLIIVQKKCRCGQHSKELPCSKSFLCETKCKLVRDCKKHICNKKCCNGQCPPCDKICAKILSCRKHKCKSVCHDGPCYPCELKSQLKCRCGFTGITVPCGREKKTRPPKCNRPCRLPVKCHHDNPHRCHMNDCPPCAQTCNIKNNTTNCMHICEAKCHDAVKVSLADKNTKATNIWEHQFDMFELKKFPHPRCEIKVSVECIGGHETALWPCWNSKQTSCGRKCDRSLNCGNHTCQKECHSVSNIDLKVEHEGCEKCEEGCNILRPTGCTHPCQKPCHIPPCEPCFAMVKVNCYCGLTQLFYRCSEYYNGSTKESHEMQNLKCCGNRCIKNYSCGHRCSSVCHAGICPYPDQCRKKVKIYCDCKNLKSEISCDKYRKGFTSILCNENCVLKKQSYERIAQEEKERTRYIAEERNRLEREQFEKKFAKKKYRERYYAEDNMTDNKNIKTWLLLGCLVVMFIAVFIIFLFK